MLLRKGEVPYSGCLYKEPIFSDEGMMMLTVFGKTASLSPFLPLNGPQLL